MQKSTIANDREREAADAYLAFLQRKGAPSHMLYKCSAFLDAFISKLAGKKQLREVYAYALEDMLEESTKDNRSQTLSIAREFFPFWVNDIKAIAMFEKYYGFSIKEIKWKPEHKTLQALTQELNTTVLNAHERQSLNAYIKAITKLGADDTIIETRTKFAKMILFRLREAPVINHVTYRMAVDLTLPLFTSKEIKQLYLDVVREFYGFWKDQAIEEVELSEATETTSGW